MKVVIKYTSDNKKPRIEEIKNLQELLDLMNKEGHSLILSDSKIYKEIDYFKSANISNKEYDYVIEVYNGYRE